MPRMEDAGMEEKQEDVGQAIFKSWAYENGGMEDKITSSREWCEVEPGRWTVKWVMKSEQEDEEWSGFQLIG